MKKSSVFHFKKFSIAHDRCAMKVGTDGVLVGAVAKGGKTILDIGTGSGLIALMMAQRFPMAYVTGIDIDEEAVDQASANGSNSPFAMRLSFHNITLQEFANNEPTRYESIVCNPPFYDNGLHCPDDRRTAARHTSALPFQDLMSGAAQLLAPEGIFTLIAPAEYSEQLINEGDKVRLYPTEQYLIRHNYRKPVKRTILSFSNKIPKTTDTHEVILAEGNERSEWYENVTKDFYIIK